MQFEKFLKRLSRTEGSVSVSNGVVVFSNGHKFDLAACLANKAYAVIQEGGSSTELYLHAHDSKEAAEQDRVDCAKGAYRTGDIVEIPGVLNALSESFYGTVDGIIDSLGTLDTVPIPEEDVGPYDDDV